MYILKKIRRNLLYLLKLISGKYSHLYTNINLKTEYFGNEYGGFYLSPFLIRENPIIMSFGIGEDISFDRAISDRFNCKVHCFDPTPKSIGWFRKQSPETVKNLKFYEYGLSKKSGKTKFFLPKNKNYISGSNILFNSLDENDYVNVNLKNITDICVDLKIKKIDVLKMDIEGSEYEVIESLISSNIFIGQILVEFHDRFFNKKIPKSYISTKLLKENGYFISQNSKTFEEISFVHSSLLKEKN